MVPNNRKCGRPDFPPGPQKSVAASLLLLIASRGGSTTKKYPRHQNPASYPGYTREFLYELPGPAPWGICIFS